MMRDKDKCIDFLKGSYQILFSVSEIINMFQVYYLNVDIMKVKWNELMCYNI